MTVFLPFLDTEAEGMVGLLAEAPYYPIYLDVGSGEI